jgi:ketosteroid isomerase-like protein
METLRRAIESSDAEILMSLYADDAEMTIVDRMHAPSDPMALRGKSEIMSFWRDVCGRNMKHKVEREVVGDDRVALVESCEYPDGCRVMAAMMLDLADGRISRHLTVQAWDDTAPGASAEA